MRRWWLVIALLLSVGMNIGLLTALTLRPSASTAKQQEPARPTAPGRIPQLAARLGLEGVQRRRFIERQRRFFAETATPRLRLPELRQEVRTELIQPHPDRARIDDLLQQSSAVFLSLEHSLVNNVLDTREILGPEADRKYIDLISRLQLEGPGQLGRLPSVQGNRLWGLRP